MKFIIFVFLILLQSCSFSKTDHKVILVKPKIGTGNFSDYFFTKKNISLETNEKCLIGSVSLVRLCNNKNILIGSNLNKKSSEAFIFNENGGFLFQIGKKGQGPGEYSTIFDINTDDDNNFYLLDSNKIHIYNEFGQFTKTIIVKFFPSKIFIKNDNIFLIRDYNGIESSNFYEIYRFDKNGNTKGSYSLSNDLYNFQTVFSPIHYASSNKNYLSLLFFYGRRIKTFDINKSKIFEYIFDEDNCDDNLYVRKFMMNNLYKNIPKNLKEKVFKKLHRFEFCFNFKNNRLLLINGPHCDNKGTLLLFDIITKKCIDTKVSFFDKTELVNKNLVLPFRGYAIKGHYDNGFIVVCEDSEFLEKNKQKLGFNKYNFTPNSNPVISFIELKKDL